LDCGCDYPGTASDFADPPDSTLPVGGDQTEAGSRAQVVLRIPNLFSMPQKPLQTVPEPAEQLVDSGFLAKLFGLSDTRITSLGRSGILPRRSHPDNPRQGVYPLVESFKAYLAHLTSDERLANQKFLEEKAKLTESKRRKEDLQSEIVQGAMVRRDALLETLEPIIARYRRSMLSRQSRLERRLSRCRDREKRLAILDQDARESLNLLAEMLEAPNGQNGTEPLKPKKKAS
jgi:hypothetical protein